MPAALRAFASGLIAVLALATTVAAEGDPRDDAFPKGWQVTKTVEMPAAQVEAIGGKLGATLTRITNTVWTLGGLGIQVNVVTAADAEAAERAEAALAKMRGPGFVGRRGLHVVEIAGQGRLPAQFALAHLGVLPEAEVEWTVDMKIGCVESLDYMTANKVFNHFIALDGGGDGEAIEPKIRALTSDWKTGDAARLLTARRPWFRAHWTFDPEPDTKRRHGDVTTFGFETLPTRVGIPFIHVTGTVEVAPRFTPVEIEGDEGRTAATAHWPADDPKLVELAKAVTHGAESGRDRVRALLVHTWGRLRYAGETGSRYGVAKVLEQGFGHCWDKSDVFITLCRAAGIPARQVAGWVPSMKSGHVWAEAKIPGEGWIPVDPTTPWLGTGTDYVPLYRSEDGDMPIVYVAWPEIAPAR